VSMRRGQVAVLDFGAQYTQLIARRVREAGVYCEIWPHTATAGELRAAGVRAVILSGGPASVYEPGAPQADPELLRGGGLPVLGICYGHQLLAKACGGRVEADPGGREYGRADLLRDAEGQLLHGLPPRTPVWMSHGDTVLQAPPGFTALAHTDRSPVAAMADAAGGRYGVQFHLEVAHTPLGAQVLRNFLFDICGLEPDWSMASFAEEAVAAVRAQVGPSGRAVVGLSGGVDSAVAAELVRRAIGDRLTAIFVDHGLLRAGEREEVEAAFAGRMPLRVVDAGDRFLGALHGVTDPEAKRKIVGAEFVAVFEREAARIGPVDFLVQGTVYPDVVESGATGKAAQTIKSHHNVGGLPERMRLRLVEPLRTLFKDEVRRLGEELGLPPTLVWRQPFPGPGLAIRIIGAVTPERLATLRHADRILREELAPRGLGQAHLWQAFAVLPGIRSVGVMGDARTYGELVAIRAVSSEDGMTADWARLPHEVLERIASRIVNEVPGVNRVVYDITSKPPATIEWE
jgi:GMP synthase (glutamine-hydrolysing)